MKVKANLSSSCTCLVLEVFIGQHRSYGNKEAAPASIKVPAFFPDFLPGSPASLWMVPTFCRYSLLPMDEDPKKLGDCKLPGRVGIVWILLGLLVVGLLVAVSVLAAKVNSPACKDGLRAEQECRNITHLLEQELTQAQDALQRTEAQAATCNETVETLNISLEKEKAGGRKQQELMRKLQEEIKTLNQSLQDKSSELQDKSEELEKLRQENEALVSAKCPPNSGISLHLSLAPVLLTLSLQTLLA